MKFYDDYVDFDLWDFYDEACVPRLLCYSAAKFELLRWLIYEGLNCYLFIFEIFEKCDIPLGDYSDLFKKFLCWENGVLQLVSEQVGPSGQVVESCSVEYQLIYCYVSYWLLCAM